MLHNMLNTLPKVFLFLVAFPFVLIYFLFGLLIFFPAQDIADEYNYDYLALITNNVFTHRYSLGSSQQKCFLR